MKTLRRFLRDERGIESAEWALILGIIVLAAVTAATTAEGPAWRPSSPQAQHRAGGTAAAVPRNAGAG